MERTFRTSLFDYGIDVVTWPVEYTWDFGDGQTLTTTTLDPFEVTELRSHLVG